MKLFIDTWGWLTLRDRSEVRHQEVRSYYEAFRQAGGTGCTTDYVLDETITLLFRRLDFQAATESVGLLQKAIAEGYLHLEQVTPERFEKAKQLRFRLRDKLRISFTDLTSMVVMQERGVTHILTEDEHFAHVGLGLQTVP